MHVLHLKGVTNCRERSTHHFLRQKMGSVMTTGSTSTEKGRLGKRRHQDGDDTGSSTPPKVFRSEPLTEVKTLLWEIKNFAHLASMNAAMHATTLQFEAGQDIGILSKWSLYLKRNAEDFLGLFLKPVSIFGVDPLHGKLSFEIMGKDGRIVRRGQNEVPENFTERLNNWGGHAGFGFGLPRLATILDPNSNYLDDGSLNIRIRLELIYYSTQEHRKGGNYVKTIRNRCGTYEEIGKCFSDVLIRTRDGQEFSGHKVILSEQSKVFHAMFSTPMSESRDGIVVIDDMDGPAFKELLNFMYSGKVDEDWDQREDFEQIIYGATKYDLQHLRDYCDDTLDLGVNEENAIELLKVAKLYDLPSATEEITDYIMSKPRVLKELINSVE